MSLLKKAPVSLYAERTFTQKFNDTFEFCSRNWKVLLRTLTYFLLPLSILQALSLNAYMQGMMDMQGINSMTGADGALIQSLSGYAATVVFSVIGMTLMAGIVYSIMAVYEDKKDDVNSMTLKQLWPIIRRKLLRAAAAAGIIIAFSVSAIILGVLLALISPFLIVIPLFGYLALIMPLSLLYPICVFEKISLVEAVKKVVDLGFKTWGGILAITFVVSLVVGIVSNMVGAPYGILIMMKSAAGLNSSLSTFTNGPIYTAAIYIFGVLTTFVSYIGYSIVAVALAYQYGHAAEKFDTERIADQISDFDNLKQGPDKGKDNGSNGISASVGNGMNANPGTDGSSKPRFDEIDDFEKL